LAAATTGATKGNLFFLECATACTDSTNWTTSQIADNVDALRPGISAAASTVMVGYGAEANTYAAYCDDSVATCTAMTNWTAVSIEGMDPKHEVGVSATSVGASITLELAADIGRFYSCDGNCGTKGAWPSGDPGIGTVNSALAFLGTPLPRVAGVTSTGVLKYSQCTTLPCTASGSWTMAPSTSASTSSEIDLDLLPDGGPSILYVDPTGTLARYFGAGTAWTSEAVNGCGQPLVGTQPSQRVGPTGISVLYTSGNEVRYHVP
jgi:hypothetical protein